MDNLDDSENNAKISDSAYSNSCSNSQSRKSHSSKSTHSGSNSSGSSGYGGKPSTSGSSNNLQPPKKEKEPKKKREKLLLPQSETLVPDVVVEEVRPPEPAPTFDAPQEEQSDVIPTQPPVHTQAENGVENMEICVPELTLTKDEVVSGNMLISQVNSAASFVIGRPLQASYCSVQSKLYQEIGRYEMRCESSEQLRCKDGFSCVISMHDGVVMYATSTLTTTLGFPKDMWIGRSFIDFVHPRDRNTFASQITNGLAVPKVANGTQEKAVPSPANPVSSMVCRIRRYRGLTSGFGVKERVLGFMPFLLKLTFKNISDEEGKVIYLVIQATPFYSAFKTPNEVVSKPVPFVVRHAADGLIEYVDPESVPYLGYLPQDIVGKDALMLYHPKDLLYLRQVYDTIVKEGGLARSKAYRMLTQNGDYLRLETEWSSFINPWSKKLEFVIGKHHILEGPTNPDVFQFPQSEKSKIPEEEVNKAKMLRETIIRTMNEALTKPAEIAKQQMSKRCQDLASFMESLLEEAPKPDEELRLEIQDADHSYYERDSVMLGGISPHHDYYDSKSSTETPLSYNQLNYNETLQRYFGSHQPISQDEYHTVIGENNHLHETRPLMKYATCLSPMAQQSRDSGEMTSSSDSNGMVIGSNSPVSLGDYQPMRLTESLLSKHNAEMEKELMKMHRETRSSSKGDREKNSNETRKKKKEHLARCNASYHPTSVGATNVDFPSPHGLKRPSKMMESEAGAHKHHCPSPARQRRHKRTLSTNAPCAQPSSTVTTTVGQLATASTHWSTPPANSINSYVMGVGMPQQMSIMSPMPHSMQPIHHMQAVPGMIPMYYAPAPPQPMPDTSGHHQYLSTNQQHPFQGPMMMYGQPMYGPPFMYSPVTQQVTYPMQQFSTTAMNPLGLTSSNYEEACKPSISLRPNKVHGYLWHDKNRPGSQGTSSKTDIGSGDSLSSTNALNRESGPCKSHSGNEDSTIYSTDMKSSSLSPKRSDSAMKTPPLRESRLKMNRHGTEETLEKTDGESSYSSFYSSFFKTESGSAEDSGDGKNGSKQQSPVNASSSNRAKPQPVKKVTARRKMEPPWLEQVCVTSELIYKYQIHTKSTEETLLADKQKMKNLEQPSLVNEQLSQLYLDLQLEGVAARLTLEEGITSSSSSGEETTTSVTTSSRKKREYSKLVMIYEEDAPLPPPSDDPTELAPEAESSSTC